MRSWYLLETAKSCIIPTQYIIFCSTSHNMDTSRIFSISYLEIYRKIQWIYNECKMISISNAFRTPYSSIFSVKCYRRKYIIKFPGTLTVCVAPLIICPPLFQMICGMGRAPAELHVIWVRTPATRGWFNPCNRTYNGATAK